MSNIERIENIKQIVKMVEPDFNKQALIHKAVTYQAEALFALQALQANDYLAQVAMKNQDSLKKAIINVAAIGLSLNPIKKLAYLVPRKSEICLDISYQGFIALAEEAGAIKWAHAELVYSADTFENRGIGERPVHKFDPFADRGKVIGAYCLAKTYHDEMVYTHMPIKDIYSIRDRSEAWKAGQSGPWKSDENEMIKKTVIRRAYKSWPKSDTRMERFEKALEASQQIDPIDLNALKEESAEKRAESVQLIRDHLKTLERTEEKYVDHLKRVCNREIKTLDDMTDLEMSRELVMLGEWVAAKKARGTNEVAG